MNKQAFMWKTGLGKTLLLISCGIAFAIGVNAKEELGEGGRTDVGEQEVLESIEEAKEENKKKIEKCGDLASPLTGKDCEEEEEPLPPKPEGCDGAAQAAEDLTYSDGTPVYDKADINSCSQSCGFQQDFVDEMNEGGSERFDDYSDQYYSCYFNACLLFTRNGGFDENQRRDTHKHCAAAERRRQEALDSY